MRPNKSRTSRERGLRKEGPDLSFQGQLVMNTRFYEPAEDIQESDLRAWDEGMDGRPLDR